MAVAASTLAPYDSSPMRRHVCSPAALGGGCAPLRVSAPSDVYVRDEDPSGGAHKCSGSGDFEGRTALPVLECVQQPGDIVYVPINWVSVCGTRVDNGIQLALPFSFNFVHASAKSRGLLKWWADRNTPVATLTLWLRGCGHVCCCRDQIHAVINLEDAVAVAVEMEPCW